MFDALAESTWGLPLVAALHVLGLAWFGGLTLVDEPRLLCWRRWALQWMLFTGALLFAAHPGRTASSNSFWIKLALIAAVLVFRRGPRWMRLALWAGVVAASRGIAFW